MKKYFLLAAVLALNVSSCYQYSNTTSFGYTSLPERVARSSVELMTNPSDATTLLGSGTYIYRNGEPFVLTARHVVGSTPAQIYGIWACYRSDWRYDHTANCAQALITTEDGMENDADYDLALLPLQHILPGAIPAEPLYNYNWTIGEAIIASGMPNMVYSIVSGTITGANSPTEIYTDAVAWFGISGGGVYNDEGYLIGVMKGLQVASTPWGTPQIVDGLKSFTLIPEEFTNPQPFVTIQFVLPIH